MYTHTCIIKNRVTFTDTYIKTAFTCLVPHEDRNSSILLMDKLYIRKVFMFWRLYRSLLFFSLLHCATKYRDSMYTRRVSQLYKAKNFRHLSVFAKLICDDRGATIRREKNIIEIRRSKFAKSKII